MAMSLGSRSVSSGNDSAALTVGKLGEFTHQLCVLLGAFDGEAMRKA